MQGVIGQLPHPYGPANVNSNIIPDFDKKYDSSQSDLSGSGSREFY